MGQDYAALLSLTRIGNSTCTIMLWRWEIPNIKTTFWEATIKLVVNFGHVTDVYGEQCSKYIAIIESGSVVTKPLNSHC